MQAVISYKTISTPIIHEIPWGSIKDFIKEDISERNIVFVTLLIFFPWEGYYANLNCRCSENVLVSFVCVLPFKVIVIIH